MTPEAMRELAAKVCEIFGATRTIHNEPIPETAKRVSVKLSREIRAIPISPAAAQERDTPRTDEAEETYRRFHATIATSGRRVANIEAGFPDPDDYTVSPPDGFKFSRSFECELHQANARADEAERKVRVLDAEFDDLTQRHNAYKERYTDGQERMPE